MDQKMELLAKFGLTPEQLDFDIETMSVEDLEVELSKVANKNAGQFSLTGEQFREELVNALHAEKIETAWGETYRYIYCDYNSDSSEVYCYDMDDWTLYGFTYSMNGDNVVIDFNSKKRKKVSIIDFDEGEAEFSYKHKSAKNSCKAFFINNWFLFDDPEVIDWLGMSQYYKHALNADGFDRLFEKNVPDIRSTIAGLSDGQKRSVAFRAKQLIEDGKIDSIKVINALEESLNVELIER